MVDSMSREVDINGSGVRVEGRGVGVGSAIPDGLIDNFEQVLYEEQNKTLSDYYTGDLSRVTRQQTTVNEGSYALKIDSGGSNTTLRSVSGLNAYPSQGDTFEFDVYPTGDDNNVVDIDFAVQSNISNPDRYYIAVRDRSDTVRLIKTSGGSGSIIAESTTINYTQQWYEITVDWQNDGTIVVTVFDSSDTQLDQFSGSDSDYTGGGVGYSVAAVTGSPVYYLDNYRVI